MTPRHETSVVKQNLAYYASARSAAEYTREDGLRPIEQQLIAEFMPPPPAGILDLGCGAGRTTIGLSRAGYTAIAIDLSLELLTLARRRYPHLDFRQMDATELAFPVDTFDAALFSYNGIDCLYPVAAREQCLVGVCRVLKPGATFIFSTHNLVGGICSGGYWYAFSPSSGAIPFCANGTHDTKTPAASNFSTARHRDEQSTNCGARASA